MRCANLAVLATVAVLAGCSVFRQPPAAIPPYALMEDCPEPTAQVQTNGDIVRHLRALRDALRSCNDDKAALRKWAEKQ